MSFFDKDITTEGADTIPGILQDFGNKLQADLIKSLQEEVTGFTSKQLEQSIVFDITFSSGVWRFVLSMEDYGKFIDEGVKGVGGVRKTTSKFSGANKGQLFKQNAPRSRFSFKDKKPPITNELRNWANVHGMNVYALRETIFRQGIKPNHFYSDVVNEELVSELSEKLAEAGAKGVEVSLAKLLEDGNNTAI